MTDSANITKGVNIIILASMDFESPHETGSDSPVEECTEASTFKIQDDQIRKFKQFCAFCSFILQYEDHPSTQQQEVLGVCLKEEKTQNMMDIDEADECGLDNNPDSATINCTSRNQSSESDSSSCDQYSSDDESWNSITCFCGRPFAGRPMIECSVCLTWIHLYCAKIKKNKVPETFTCTACKKKKAS